MRVTSLCMLQPAPAARGGAEDGHLAHGRSVALGRQKVMRVAGADRPRHKDRCGRASIGWSSRAARSGALEVKHADAVSPAEGTRSRAGRPVRLARSSGRQGRLRPEMRDVDGWRLMDSGSVRGGRGLHVREWVQRARTEPSQRLKVEVLGQAPQPGAGRACSMRGGNGL
jgi:hypothetical protein